MDLEQQLNRILSDPESMSKIMDLAQSLGTPTTAGQPPAEDVSHSSILQLLQNVQQAGQQDPAQHALIDALRPYVSQQHCRRLERALQMAQLSKLAGTALQSMEHP